MSNIAALYSTLKLAKTHNANASGSTQGSASTQADFAALLAQMMSGSSQAQTAGATATTSTTGSLAKDLDTLKQALSQGDMSAAQLAFQALQNDLQGNPEALQAMNPHRRHHHHAAATAAVANPTTTASASQTTAQAIA